MEVKEPVGSRRARWWKLGNEMEGRERDGS
jgi:hypothetical protein